MWTYHEPTLTKLHDSMTESLLFAKADGLDMVSNVDVQRHNVIGVADSMEWEFDLKTMWLTPARWTSMTRQYIDPDEFKAWVEKITLRLGTKERGIAVMRTKTVAARGGEATGHTNKETRRWGSCMLALSYKAVPEPTITLHSRTSYLGYIGALDLSVAWMAARYLGRELGIEPKDFKFVWMIEAIQWHNFKSLAYMLNHHDNELRAQYRRLLIKPLSKLEANEIEMIETLPAVGMSRTWLRKMMAADARGETYGDMTYNTYRRIRRRWHTEVLGYEKAQTFEGWSYYKVGEKAGQQREYFKAFGPLPSTPVQKLDFKKIGFPWGAQIGLAFDAAVASDCDNDDDDDE